VRNPNTPLPIPDPGVFGASRTYQAIAPSALDLAPKRNLNPRYAHGESGARETH